METQEQLQGRLHSLEELRTIVKTMKALSAASIRQYERAVDAVAGYYDTVEQGLQVVLRDMPVTPAPPRSTRKPAATVAIVFGSDHGLCGRFNEEIAHHARQRLATADEATARTRVLAVGARAAGALAQQDQAVDESLLVPGSADQIGATVQRILLILDDWTHSAAGQRVLLFYNRQSGGRGYRQTTRRLLPVDLAGFRHLRDRPWPSRRLPTFTMERAALLRRLVRQYLFVSLFRACAESQASEHASRLAAMQAAQRNLDERVQDVTMSYRRARQDAITAELLDVVAGFEAIAGSGD
jgi:F-type H+-transporting ATPase subunit gamma